MLVIIHEIWTKKSPSTGNSHISDTSMYQKISATKQTQQESKNIVLSVRLFLDFCFKPVGHCDALSRHVKEAPILYHYLIAFIDSLFCLKTKRISPQIEISEFFVNFLILWHTTDQDRPEGKSTPHKEVSFLIRKWSILSKQLFQVKLSMIDIFANGIWYP